MFGQQLSGQMFVVVWEPKRGAGGGHQAVMDKDKAEQVSRALMRARPDGMIRVMPAHDYGAAAVLERQQRRAMRR
jgi:predicted LPLAT superfamily acyltransferase